MRAKSLRSFRTAALALAAICLMATVALAGPPLICHAFDIGNAKSLPFVSHDWNLNGAENYDTRNLANDTLAILDGSQVPLVHMETLRRATLYARKDPSAAKQLLLKLVARARSNESAAAPNALALFDAAYLTEAYKQWLDEKGENPANGLVSSAWLQKAMQARPNDPQLAFGAALISLHGSEAEQRQYAQHARDGAKRDDLLARNLGTHFLGEQSPTMAQLIDRGNSSRLSKSDNMARQ